MAELKASGAKNEDGHPEEQFFWCWSGICFLICSPGPPAIALLCPDHPTRLHSCIEHGIFHLVTNVLGLGQISLEIILSLQRFLIPHRLCFRKQNITMTMNRANKYVSILGKQ